MSLPLFLVKRVKYLQSTDLTHVSVQVKAAISKVARSCCSVRTPLLSISTGTSSHRIFQSTANSFQIRMGLHFHVISFVTATHHITCGTGLLLFFIQATQILWKRNIVWTIQDNAQKLFKKLPVLSFQGVVGFLFGWLVVFFKFLHNYIFSSLSLFWSQTARIFTNYLLKGRISRSLELSSIYKQDKKSSHFTSGQLARLVRLW